MSFYSGAEQHINILERRSCDGHATGQEVESPVQKPLKKKKTPLVLSSKGIRHVCSFLNKEST